jgi:hypothetical protein
MSEWSAPRHAPEARQETQDQLRDLLPRLHELAVVEAHPLTARLPSALSTSTSDDAVSVCVRMRMLLTDLIERLKPDENASIPILLVFTFGMRYYIEGLTSGAIKS